MFLPSKYGSLFGNNDTVCPTNEMILRHKFNPLTSSQNNFKFILYYKGVFENRICKNK